MMEHANAKRPWCAHYQYDGRKPFVVGTVWVDAGATLHEIDRKAEVALAELFLALMPEGQSMPRLVNLVPGQIVFVAVEDLREAA